MQFRLVQSLGHGDTNVPEDVGNIFCNVWILCLPAPQSFVELPEPEQDGWGDGEFLDDTVNVTGGVIFTQTCICIIETLP